MNSTRNKEYIKSKIGVVFGFVITIITSYFKVPIIEEYAWVILLLCVLLLSILFYMGRNKKAAIYVFVFGCVLTLFLSYYNEVELPMTVATGTVNIDIERVFRVSDYENKDDNSKIIKCQSAKLTDLKTGYIYDDFEIDNQFVIFKEVKAGQYEVEIKLEGMKIYTEQIDYTIGTLAPEINAKLNRSKVYRFVKYVNPVWSEWDEWSGWQKDKVEQNSRTDVEIKRAKDPKKEEISKVKITYKDGDKPIYGYKEVEIKIDTENYIEDGIHYSKDITTKQKIKIIIDYDTSIRYDSVYYLTEDKNNVQYRFRKRELTSGDREYLYAMEENIEMLKEQGYEIDYLVH